MSLKLFILKEGQLVLYKDEILLYKPLAAVYTRDKGSPGDSDGRKKLQAWKEFTYLYMICDYASYPNQKGHSEIEAHNYALEEAELPKDWKPDAVVCAAMDFYVDYIYSVAKELNKELLASFRDSSKVVKKLRGETEKLLKLDTLTSVQTTQLTDMQSTIMEIATKLPRHLKAIQESMELIKKEEQEGEIGRGGDVIKDSQDPSTAIS